MSAVLLPVHADSRGNPVIDDVDGEALAAEALRYLGCVDAFRELVVPKTVELRKGYFTRLVGPFWKSEETEVGWLEPPCAKCSGDGCEECATPLA